MYKPGLSGSISPVRALEVIKYRTQYLLDNPNYFSPSGVCCFCGPQGSGKTYSAVKYVYQTMKDFPKSICVSNVQLFGLFDSMKDRIFPYIDVNSFTSYNNDIYGVIFLVDELHIEFNSLESKHMPPALFQQLSQQRKQRKHIIGTSQVYSRMAKPFREQMDVAVFCRNYGKLLQHNVALDGHSIKERDGHYSGQTIGSNWFYHDTRYYDSFDTYQVINTKRKGVFQ